MSTNVDTEKEKVESVEELKTQINSLIYSLETLSIEKSKIEAKFQADKNLMRNEREQDQKKIKEYKEKWKKQQSSNQSEIKHLKYELIIERHKREEEQLKSENRIKNLEKLINEERQAKAQLETQLKELKLETMNRPQSKVLETELEILKNKLKQAFDQHRKAITEEHKRVAAAEQQTKMLAETHESRVVSLEARLTELYKTVGEYDRSRQKDQQAIRKLKEQLSMLQNSELMEPRHLDYGNDPYIISDKIKELCSKLSQLDKDIYGQVLQDLKFPLISINNEFKEKYENLLKEYEEYKQQKSSMTNLSDESSKMSNEMINDRGQLQRLKTHCCNLEERIRILNSDWMHKEKEYKQIIERLQKSMQDDQIKIDRILMQKENEYRGKIINLEQQIMRQRERSLLVINEKDQEIHTLKSSFQVLLPKRQNQKDKDKTQVNTMENYPISDSAKDVVSNFSIVENGPPILHYAQELARREVEVSGLRKLNLELEATIREKERESLQEIEMNRKNITELKCHIESLEASKSREGANLEYLKNVFLNYLITTDNSSKRHMLNAITTILRFTTTEMDKIRKCK